MKQNNRKVQDLDEELAYNSSLGGRGLSQGRGLPYSNKNLHASESKQIPKLTNSDNFTLDQTDLSMSIEKQKFNSLEKINKSKKVNPGNIHQFIQK